MRISIRNEQIVSFHHVLRTSKTSFASDIEQRFGSNFYKIRKKNVSALYIKGILAIFRSKFLDFSCSVI